MNIAKFLRTAFFIEKQLPVATFVSLVKYLTVRCWASADLLLLIRNTIWDGFY